MSMQGVVPLVIGLCGGVGSGKSAVAAGLKESGCLVYDFDAAVRDKLGHDPDVARTLASWWGPEVLIDGEVAQGVDRSAVGRIVFSDDAQRQRLEALLHPLVWRTRAEAVVDAKVAGCWGVVFDAPLLFESGLDRECDVVVFVEAPESARRDRVQSTRGWDAAELSRRESAQWALERKRGLSQFVIVNDGDRQMLDSRVADLCGTLRQWSETRSTRDA